MSIASIKNQINQAAGFVAADFAIKNVNILNVLTGEIERGDIGINRETGKIVSVYDECDAAEFFDAKGELFATPGFIDCHLHVESSMVAPQVFEQAVLPHGTTTAFCDPHEMANVLGTPAFDYFLQSSDNMVMDLMVGLSTCVPATQIETSGAEILAADMAPYLSHPNVYGGAEFMSMGDVMAQDDATLEKLDLLAAHHIDGHMPMGTTTTMMNVMASCGIRNCHENTDFDHARDKLKRGIQVFIREGSVCKDAKTLAPLITPFTAPHLGFCTDDRSPLEISEEGHIDHIIRTLIAAGADMPSVYKIATWSAANHFGMGGQPTKFIDRKCGTIAPGFAADIVLLNDLKSCDIHSVLKGGAPVTQERFDARPKVDPIGYKSIKVKEIASSDFVLRQDTVDHGGIGLITDQLVTNHIKDTGIVLDETGWIAQESLDEGWLPVFVIERHGKNGNIAQSFVKGFDFKEGAMAASIGHDSHNITVVGAARDDVMLAVQRIIDNDGGKSVVRNGQVLGEIALPVAGLMSDKEDLDDIATDLKALKGATAALNSSWQDPIMMLSFLPLAVIPDTKLTDYGLTRFNPAEGIMAPTLVDDQRNKRPHCGCDL